MKIFLLILFFVLPVSLFAGEAEDLRHFLHDIISATNAEISEQPQLLRESFANYAHLLPVLADPQNSEKLFREAQLDIAVDPKSFRSEIQTMVAKIATERVQNFTQDPAFAEGFSPMLKESFYRFDHFFTQNKELAEQMQILSAEIAQMSPEDKKVFLRFIPDEVLLSLSKEIEAHIDNISFAKAESLHLLTDPKKGIKISQLNEEETKTFHNAILSYYDELLPEDRRKIIAGWLDLPPFASQEAQLAEVLHNSGPMLQKLFQLFGKDTESEQIKAVTKDLLSKVRPFSSVEAKKIIEANLGGREFHEVFSSISEKPINAGTIGQIYIATLESTGEPVAIKVRRPGLEEKMLREFEILSKHLQNVPAAKKMMEKVKEAFLRELNFEHEAAHLIEIEKYRNKKLGINTPSIIKEIPATEELLVMELVPGKPISKLEALSPELRAEAVYNTLKRWFEEVIFDTGFFHGDMHGGNLLLKPLPEEKPPFILSIIDPGNAGKLTLEQRRSFIDFTLSAISKSTDGIMEALQIMGHIPQDKIAPLRSDIETLLKGKVGGLELLDKIITQAIRQGMDIDPSLPMFSRANLFLEKELRKLNKEILAKNPSAKTFKPMNAYMRVAAKNISISLPKQLISATEREEAVMKPEALIKFVKQYWQRTAKNISSTCSNLFSKFSTHK